MSAAAATPVKPAKKAAAKPKKPAAHPKYTEMTAAALGSLKERGGSSRQAILKYIIKSYNVGKEERLVNRKLKVALRAGVKNGALKQTKGTGASGSFRLGEKAKAAPKKAAANKPKAASAAKKVKKAKTPKKAGKKVTKSPKKVTKKPAAKKLRSPVKAKKAVSKVKKPKTAAAKKPKAAKPKKVAAKKPAKKA